MASSELTVAFACFHTRSLTQDNRFLDEFLMFVDQNVSLQNILNFLTLGNEISNSPDADAKRRIRVAAEEEEREFYDHRAPQEWLDALAPLGTDPNKPFLETAPYLIAIFAQNFGVLPDGRQVKHYYATESVGIATGILLTALHNAGLASLTHTPSPMGFLNEILSRPSNERPYLLIVTGYPADDATVPDITKKSLDEIATFI